MSAPDRNTSCFLSLQMFAVRQDWQAADDQVRRDRQMITRVILATMIISVGVTWFTDQLLQDAAARSFSYEASSLCLYVGVLTWYALRRRPEGIAVAAGVYATMVVIVATVDLLTKVGMTSTAWDAPANRSNPQLNWGMLMLLSLGLVWQVMRRYPAEMHLVGLDLTHPSNKLVLGLVGGVMLGGHFVFSTAFTGALGLRLPPLPYFIWQTGYELGAAALGIECFFQGVALNHLHYERRWGIWEAALLTSALQVLLTLAKASWRVNPITIIGTLFYVFMRSMISAGLYQRTRNLLAPVISNFVFNMMAIVRL